VARANDDVIPEQTFSGMKQLGGGGTNHVTVAVMTLTVAALVMVHGYMGVLSNLY